MVISLLICKYVNIAFVFMILIVPKITIRHKLCMLCFSDMETMTYRSQEIDQFSTIIKCETYR